MLKKTAGIAAAVAAAATVFAGTAGAAPSTVAVADGSDPISTGCASSAITARSAYGSSGGVNRVLVELRYSTRCATAWARITTLNVPACVPGEDYCGHVWVIRNSDGREFDCVTPGGGHGCYTAQVNDNRVTSYAYGFVEVGANSVDAQTGSYLR
ncbi:DUF2690 domain-containing protein [Amycolatopsis sp. NPDC004747]